MIESLITPPDLTDLSTVPDYWLHCACNVELGLQAAGARPGIDYSILDLFKLARPLVVAELKKGSISLVKYG
jgi:hypothetical protein